jgi:secreted protein with Ig-like and vWFA domain
MAGNEGTVANGVQSSNDELDEAKKRLASATDRLKRLRDERTAMLKVTKDVRATPAAASKPAPAAAIDETSTAKEPVSTFSLHVSDVSFRLAVVAVAATARGENSRMPEIRAEEFYNAFDYGDPSPAVAEKVGARIEQSAHPFLQQRNLLRIAMKVPATGRGAGQPLRLTVLLDTSGSMEREDRRAAVRRALEELIALLGPNDRVTLIGFARQPRLLAEAVPGDQAARLVELSARTPAEGGTNLEQALKVAGELALRHRLPAAQNRMVLLTDGAANLGSADPAQLALAIQTLRQQGIAFDACGIGLEGEGDNVLEALTRKGDGRYYVIDRPEAADAAFARQLAGAFRPAAENVKLQVRFNPARVGNYRLIGFEQHRLREEDFRNDQVDAAELAAEEAATALYQIEVQPEGAGEIGEVYVRFRDAATGAMVERSWTIRYDPQAPRFDRATPSLQLAGVAALLAEKLSDSPLASQFKLGDFAGVVNALSGHYANDTRVQELVTLYGQLRRISGE